MTNCSNLYCFYWLVVLKKKTSLLPCCQLFFPFLLFLVWLAHPCSPVNEDNTAVIWYWNTHFFCLIVHLFTSLETIPIEVSRVYKYGCRSLNFRSHCTTWKRLWSRVNIVITWFTPEILLCTGSVESMVENSFIMSALLDCQTENKILWGFYLMALK